MSGYRKLSRTSDQRKALLRGQVTALLYHGKIRTTWQDYHYPHVDHADGENLRLYFL